MIFIWAGKKFKLYATAFALDIVARKAMNPGVSRCAGDAERHGMARREPGGAAAATSSRPISDDKHLAASKVAPDRRFLPLPGTVARTLAG
jgi:hypothetical protein